MKSGNGGIEIFGASVIGASHITQNKPCQDALLIREEPQYVLACVADGHGSKSCPYSAQGAEAAVQVAAGLIASVFQNEKEAFATLDAHKEIWLPKQLEERWKTRVKEIHTAERDEVDFHFELYGTTLLALAATADFAFAMQIGDGDLLTISPHQATGWFIPPMASVGNETESLCMENCWQYVRTRIMPFADIKHPLMFLLSTDGYANSFAESAGFLQAGEDIFTIWKDEGIAAIQQNLKDWLTRSSAGGSGDDITLAMVVRA